MSCRCVQEQWQRDRDKQRSLGKKTSVMLGRPQVLYKYQDGKYRFVTDGEKFSGTIEEIITQY